ncbi:NAD(P)-binding protein [Aspergillus sclerotioniger CBS 115572]|uniref:NAD(P)-binding protein n=1 Tax=Aspergillus sclerotioniger CBS 115572 TaxID=1450535 RepID=A0A317UUF2_9EURO|nr:NAD(P)-binding protein [Aspergillus sclerotioniger CBS 115572]PWY65006.1 NAD(P)-binding protein [Aspergillus sclerotioniger CBS 115572]
MPTPKTYLITGSSRGIGRALVTTFFSRPNNTIIAAVRNPQSPEALTLTNLPVGPNSHLIIIKIDSTVPTDASTAVTTLQQAHGITHLDIVIANAGICDDLSPVHTVPIDIFREHIEVNGFGPLYLFQAVYPLLQKSENPTFVGLGSPLGSIGGMEQRPYPCTAYGPSKAILHWLVRKVHFENEGWVSFVVDPGFPATDMGNAGARRAGLEKAFQTVEESVGGIVNLVDGATREEVGGQLRIWDGSVFPW